MKNILYFLLIVIMPSICNANVFKEEPVKDAKVWFSYDWHTTYFEFSLDPEEDTPFHYGVWGLERGTHIFEMSLRDQTREFKHSEICPCIR